MSTLFFNYLLIIYTYQSAKVKGQEWGKEVEWGCWSNGTISMPGGVVEYGGQNALAGNCCIVFSSLWLKDCCCC